MIIFDYATLADDSHRRHFIDPSCNSEYSFMEADGMTRMPPSGYFKTREGTSGFIRFKPDYEAYYAAEKDDKPIHASLHVFNRLIHNGKEVEIWSDYNKSERIYDWLYEKVQSDWYSCFSPVIRFRPDGDKTPWNKLKEKWVRERDSNIILNAIDGTPHKTDVEIAFERSGLPMIEIWKEYGVPVMEVHV